MEESRINKVFRNMGFSLVYKLSDVFLAFVLRTVFIRQLGVNYLGISGLFSSILTVLSLMELGVGSAIAFSLYQPLATQDDRKITAFMQLYKRTYTCIGTVVCLVGVALTPFLPRIINLQDHVDHLILIYWLSVANTATTYFLAYKRTLLIADQKSYICTQVDIRFRVIRCVSLIAVLVFTHNYVLYLIVDVLNTLACNIVVSGKVKRIYPYLATTEAVCLDKKEKRNIIKYMSSTLLVKFGQTCVNSTDSIITSALVSTAAVGLSSNYQIIYYNLDMVLYLVFSNITASIGNFVVSNTGKQSFELFKKINLANYMITCVASVGLFCLLTPFITLWLGEAYCLSEWCVAIIVINFYLTANQNAVGNFMNAMGELQYHNRFRPLVEGVVNLVSSIALVKYTNLGLTGVFLGTTICYLTGRVWMDARILYKDWFQEPFTEYLWKMSIRSLLFAVLCAIMKRITTGIFHIMGIKVYSFLLCMVCCVVGCSALLIFLYRKTDEYAYMKLLARNLLEKIVGRKSREN